MARSAPTSAPLAAGRPHAAGRRGGIRNDPLYPVGDGTFDPDCCSGTQMQLVEQHFGPTLERTLVTRFRATRHPALHHVIGTFVFPDRGAFDAAMAAAPVLDDIPKFPGTTQMQVGEAVG